ncbi:hypothetical protein EDB83DRAFT_2528623 [Lactarius deliciosus]|nr:hypothetical protein EDB83DRAFT_2528623 [Lactarius deliciosus]
MSIAGIAMALKARDWLGVLSAIRRDTERVPCPIDETDACGQNPPFDDVARRGDVFSVVLGNVRGLGEGTSRETEAFANLFTILQKQKHAAEFCALHLRLRSPRSSTANPASINDELRELRVSPPTLRSDLSSERPRPQRRGSLGTLSRRLFQSEAAAPCRDTAYQSPESASRARRLSALDAIAEALTDSPIIDFDPLVRPMRSSLRKRSSRSPGYS